jgi:hypothetical protein
MHGHWGKEFSSLSPLPLNLSPDFYKKPTLDGKHPNTSSNSQKNSRRPFLRRMPCFMYMVNSNGLSENLAELDPIMGFGKLVVNHKVGGQVS